MDPTAPSCQEPSTDTHQESLASSNAPPAPTSALDSGQQVLQLLQSIAAANATPLPPPTTPLPFMTNEHSLQQLINLHLLRNHMQHALAPASTTLARNNETTRRAVQHSAPALVALPSPGAWQGWPVAAVPAMASPPPAVAHGPPAVAQRPPATVTMDTSTASLSLARTADTPQLDHLPRTRPVTLQLQAKKRRGYRHESFPVKLHRMLREMELAGRSHVCSFTDNGLAFVIHKPDAFLEILPVYFRHKQLSSFKRLLNMYGFSRIHTGSSIGGFSHPMFQKAHPELCGHMKRSSELEVIVRAKPP